MGTIQGFCASKQASEIWAGVEWVRSAIRFSRSTTGWFAARFAGEKRSNPARRSVFGSRYVGVETVEQFLHSIHSIRTIMTDVKSRPRIFGMFRELNSPAC